MADKFFSHSDFREPDPQFVQGLFGGIASTYDKANDVITFGMARRWRRQLVKRSGAQPGHRVLDCATGTGDLALEFKKAVGPSGEVIGSDFCKEMIELAGPKAQTLNLQVEFEWGDVTELKYDSNQFDICSIAYGIRNVSSIEKALTEMARVVKPGGQVVILETGENRNPLLRSAIGIYFKHLVPRMGGWVSGRRDAYEYLNRSSSQFPCREAFLALMTDTGCFSQTSFTSLMGGASFIYSGTVK